MARGKFTAVSSLARTESLLVLLQTGFRHQARGPNASTKVEPANDRPSPRSVLIQMSTQLEVSNHRAGFRRQTAAAWRWLKASSQYDAWSRLLWPGGS